MITKKNRKKIWLASSQPSHSHPLFLPFSPHDLLLSNIVFILSKTRLITQKSKLTPPPKTSSISEWLGYTISNRIPIDERDNNQTLFPRASPLHGPRIQLRVILRLLAHFPTSGLVEHEVLFRPSLSCFLMIENQFSVAKVKYIY